VGIFSSRTEHDESSVGHEVCPVAFVVRDGCDAKSGLLRELQYPGDHGERTDIVVISAGCECGWRSTRFAPRRAPRWYPYTCILADADDEEIHALAAEHFADVHGKWLRSRR